MSRLRLPISILMAMVFIAVPQTSSAAPMPDKSINALFELKHPKGLQGFARSVSTPGSRKYQQ